MRNCKTAGPGTRCAFVLALHLCALMLPLPTGSGWDALVTILSFVLPLLLWVSPVCREVPLPALYRRQGTVLLPLLPLFVLLTMGLTAGCSALGSLAGLSSVPLETKRFAAALMNDALLPAVCEEGTWRMLAISVLAADCTATQNQAGGTPFPDPYRSAAAACSLLFAFAHRDPIRLLPALLAGWILAILVRHGGILLAVLFHAVNNTVSLLTVYFSLQNILVVLAVCCLSGMMILLIPPVFRRIRPVLSDLIPGGRTLPAAGRLLLFTPLLAILLFLLTLTCLEVFL